MLLLLLLTLTLLLNALSTCFAAEEEVLPEAEAAAEEADPDVAGRVVGGEGLRGCCCWCWCGC